MKAWKTEWFQFRSATHKRDDKELRIQTIQTIIKKESVSLVEFPNVIKSKESANKEAGGSQPHLKGEYFEEPNTTQKDIRVEIETEKEKGDGND